MRALAIDPHAKTISSVIVHDPAETLEGIKAWIGCDLFDIMRIGDSLWFIDEEGLLKNRDTQAYWRLTGPAPLAQQCFAGRALVFGTRDGGECAEPFFTAQQLAGIVEWRDAPDDEELQALCTPTIKVRQPDGTWKEV